MSSQMRRSLALNFVDRHGLWSDAQARAATDIEKTIARQELELIRFSFPDQHGILRGKTLVASEALRALRSGVTMTSTLFAKDTSHRTVFPVFEAGAGMGVPEMGGAGNFVMVADPETFRVLPWADKTGWVLCDSYFANGKTVPISTRQLYRDALAKLGAAGFDFLAGLEVEFHLFKIEDPQLASETLTWPAEPPRVSHTTTGYQYLTEGRYDQVAPILDTFRKCLAALGLPLQSLEVEFGPSQYEFTFAPQTGLAPADAMVLFRSTLKQVAHRHGHLVSFMCRPRLPNTLASGWHLHQSLLDSKTGANAFASQDDKETLSRFRPQFSWRAVGKCTRRQRVLDADAQWLQALSRQQYDGAGSGGLGAGQSRRDAARDGWARRSVDASGESLSASHSPIRTSTWRRRSMPASMASRVRSIRGRRPTRRTGFRPRRYQPRWRRR